MQGPGGVGGAQHHSPFRRLCSSRVQSHECKKLIDSHRDYHEWRGAMRRPGFRDRQRNQNSLIVTISELKWGGSGRGRSS